MLANRKVVASNSVQKSEWRKSHNSRVRRILSMGKTNQSSRSHHFGCFQKLGIELQAHSRTRRHWNHAILDFEIRRIPRFFLGRPARDVFHPWPDINLVSTGCVSGNPLCNVRGFARQAEQLITIGCDGDDTRDTGYERAIIALMAKFDTGSYQARWKTDLEAIYNNHDVGGKACKQTDNSFANASFPCPGRHRFSRRRIVSMTILGAGLLALSRPIRMLAGHWVAMTLGGALILMSLMWDYQNLMAGGLPELFAWRLFGAGELVGTVAFLHAFRSSKA
jgi:hypothetical protein